MTPTHSRPRHRARRRRVDRARDGALPHVPNRFKPWGNSCRPRRPPPPLGSWSCSATTASRSRRPRPLVPNRPELDSRARRGGGAPPLSAGVGGHNQSKASIWRAHPPRERKTPDAQGFQLRAAVIINQGLYYHRSKLGMRRGPRSGWFPTHRRSPATLCVFMMLD